MLVVILFFVNTIARTNVINAAIWSQMLLLKWIVLAFTPGFILVEFELTENE